MSWTPQQEKAIRTRGSSILVSASAGSGKTAVLVERILQQVLDKEHPCDIDQFLVVTFTNAAAAQMREKIAGRLEKALAEEPESEHLMRQLVLVNNADITTIDSFCLRLVKEHFSLLDLDSVFNIGDSGMMTLIQNDVMTQMFDEKYAAEDKNAFERLLDCFGSGNDTALQDAIYRIYNLASSFPRPDVWIKQAKSALCVSSWEELENTEWMKQFIRIVHAEAKEALAMTEEARSICCTAGGPDKYLPAVDSDAALIEAVCNADSYGALYGAFHIPWQRLAACKGEMYDDDLKEQFKAVRDMYKTLIKDVNLFRYPSDKVLEQMRSMGELLIPLLDLVQEFSERFAKAKEKRRLMDFADIEHLAYRLVCEGYDASGRQLPTTVGKQVSERYREIYIDEYQDSNFLQEDILCSVSGMHRGVYNLFMVGDVKQSIYRFRMARPDLFLGKYNRFEREGKEVKIELLHNFRSRDYVLRAANYFFYQLMGSDLGGICYDESAALVVGASFKEPRPSYVNYATELLIADRHTGNDVETAEEQDGKETAKKDLNVSHMSGIQLEAHMVAGRIYELVNGENPMYVYDEATNVYRKAEYRDIVILGRSIKKIGEPMRNALTMRGIPVYLEDPKGYFNAVEIRVIVSLLAVVDNTRQDIPLAAVLLSPIAGMTENELARVCAYAENSEEEYKLLCDKCRYYVNNVKDDVSRKLTAFFDILNELKKEKTRLSISSLIWKALRITGYYDYASAMPMGKKRRANIDMLMEKANQFEDGYYKGLFHFLRYIEKLKLQDVDFGEANTLGDEADVVRIMSMHKSKGLEYPVVFVSGLGAWFNKQDTREMLVLHSDFYLSAMSFFKESRYKQQTFLRSVMQLLQANEGIAEELRVLYVAMTRAKEKMYLTGATADFEKLYAKAERAKTAESYLLPYSLRKGARSFLEHIVACMVRYESLATSLDAEGVIQMSVIPAEEAVSDAQMQEAKHLLLGDDIYRMAQTQGNNSYYPIYKKSFSYVYPFDVYTKLHGKLSVSDVKKMRAYDGQGYDIGIWQKTEAENETQNEMEVDIKNGLKKVKNSKNKGASYGTLMHKFMELLPFARLQGVKKDMYREFLTEHKRVLLSQRILDEDECQLISDIKVAAMLASPLGQRMIAADSRGELFKEQQFSAGLNASKLYEKDYADIPETEDFVIIQGIVDAFFYENGEIVLLDYKTDRADADVLRRRYRAQLDTYGKILEQLTGCTVKEKVFYSFYLEAVLSAEGN